MKKFVTLILLIYSIFLFSQDITNSTKILSKIDSLIIKYQPEIKTEISYPPDYTVIRVFKEEKECEIWAKNSSQDSLSLIMVVPICSMDFEPGPKLKEGDSKTPEGFYYGDFAYYSSNWFMWIDLNDINEYGNVGDGSAFRICLDYPNSIDRKHTQLAAFPRTGGAICVHGNCVSIGCISFSNKNFLPVYAFSRHHNSAKYGKIQYHIFPFRFSGKTDLEKERLSQQFVHQKKFNPKRLMKFWKNLQFGYDLFNKHKMPLKVISNRIYLQEHDLSENISIIKQFLHNKGYNIGKINSIFDSELKSAIIAYQNNEKLIADGKIGTQTIKQMEEAGMKDLSIEYIYLRN